MKKFFCGMMTAAIAACALFSFAGCGSDTITQTPNVGVEQGASESVGKYDTVAYYEQDRAQDVRIAFEANKIQKVSFMFRVLGGGDWSFKNDVLTVKKSVFESETAGEKKLRVFVDDKYVEVKLRIVTKVIRTTEDFNVIRTNLNGVYVLGNDIDFGNETFWPIGKAVADGESTGIFEGIFDGMGYALKNITINAFDRSEGEDEYGQGPSLGEEIANGRNYSNGIFMQTSGNAQIINTNFVNITVNSQGMSGAVAGANGGLIKNCRVTCTLNSAGWFEKAGGIAGTNGSNDSNGRIENCIVMYNVAGGYTPRGIADWNGGLIQNCYAAPTNNYVFHIGYDPETKRVPEDFDYDDFISARLKYYAENPTYTTDNNGVTTRTLGFEICFGYPTLVALPGSMDNGNFYKTGDIVKSEIVRKEFLLNPANFPASDGWDSTVWHFEYGMYPTLRIQQR